MLNYAAIDFETANNFPSSVCSVGVVIVKNGKVEREIYRLIHPVPNFYSSGNVKVHGLTKKDTDCEDTFPEVWAEIVQYIEGLPLVAHFSRFDEGCLKAVHARFEMSYPNYRFYCTCTASRKHFGRTLPNHRLPTVAKACGFNLELHHHALADARACACIWLFLTEGRKLSFT